MVGDSCLSRLLPRPVCVDRSRRATHSPTRRCHRYRARLLALDRRSTLATRQRRRRARRHRRLPAQPPRATTPAPEKPRTDYRCSRTKHDAPPAPQPPRARDHPRRHGEPLSSPPPRHHHQPPNSSHAKSLKRSAQSPNPAWHYSLPAAQPTASTRGGNPHTHIETVTYGDDGDWSRRTIIILVMQTLDNAISLRPHKGPFGTFWLRTNRTPSGDAHVHPRRQPGR